ncbi:DUF4836 family protein [Ferruginibacter sp.]|nr:DUF4836 family protein [Ferruginibacter sp.]
MQLRFRIPFLAAVAILLLASCSKKNKEGKFVPKDAAVVVHVNGASLSSKLPWDEIKKNALFQKMYADSSIPTFIKGALENPDNSGIDTKTDMIFFMQKDSVGGIIVFTGAIKDAEKFKLFSLDITKGGTESEKDGIKFITKSPFSVGWNNEKFVCLVNAPELSMNGYKPSSWGDSTYTVKSRDLSAACKTIFDLKESNSLAEDEKFTELVKQPGDLHFWMNSEELYKDGLANPAMAMLNLTTLYKGSRAAATLNFENGKILMDIKSYAGKELTELYKKYGGKNIDEEMIKRLPSKDVAAVFAMSYKPEGIKELLKLMGVEGYANMGLAFAGFSLDDFIKANKGDVLIALTEIKHKKDSIKFKGVNGEDKSFETNTPQPEFIFATSIGDKDAFNLLIKAGEKFGKNVPAEIPVAYNSNGKYFAIGNSKENIAKYTGTNSNTSFDFLSNISGEPFGGYINLQYIMKAFESEATKDSTAKAVYDASLKMWDNVYMKGGSYSGGGITQTMEINLIDKNTNSLKQLNQYLGTLGQLKMESDKKMEMTDVMMEEVKPDSANSPKLPPPPPAK